MILVGDNRETIATLEDGAYQALFTSPPYWAPPKGRDRGGLRKYGDDATAEIGAEPTLDLFCESIVRVMRAAWPKLRDDSTAWVNLGDSYSADGEPNMVPFAVARALQQDGWTLRAMLPWVKIASMPESVQSRPSISHEYVLFLTKRPSGYFYDADAVRVANLTPAPLKSWADRKAAGEPMRQGIDPIGSFHSGGVGQNPAGRSLRSSDVWRAGARSAAEQLLAAADGQAIGLITNDDAPAALVVNPKGSGIPHFAMWPTRLVAPMVLASTPEKVCGACSAPWKRVVERSKFPRESTAHRGDSQWAVGAAVRRDVDMTRSGQEFQAWKAANPDRTLGFAPSCACNAPTRPARILDPFAGAATTLAVAEVLGREAVGCELYQKNADLYPQRKAIVAKEVAKHLAERGDAPSPASGAQQLTIEGIAAE